MRNANLESLSPGPTLIDRAYEAILAAICDGRLTPGQRVNQDALAALLQISRQPVGQALSILKSQGFVRDNGRRGLLVAPLEREVIRSIYQLREALDAMAARLAAQRCSPADLAEGRRLLAAGRKAIESRSRIAANPRPTPMDCAFSAPSSGASQSEGRQPLQIALAINWSFAE